MKTINTTQNIIISKKWEWKKLKSQELLENLNSVSNEEIGTIGDEIDAKVKEKKEKWRKETIARMEARIKKKENEIIKNLRDCHVRINGCQEINWIKGKTVLFDLPAVWNFKWFKFNFFISDKRITKGVFEKISFFKKESKFERQAYSLKEICELMEALRDYMKELESPEDYGMNYEKDLKYWETQKTKCHVWKFLKSILWLDDPYWLKDKSVDWKEKSRVWRDCSFDLSAFNYCVDNDCKWKLLLKVNNG